MILEQLKRRRPHLFQKELPHLKKRYWGQRFWAKGYRAFSTRNITDEIVQNILKKMCEAFFCQKPYNHKKIHIFATQLGATQQIH